MPFTLDEDTPAGRSLVARGEAHGTARTYATLMRRTFGDDPRIDEIAARLARHPRERALDIALKATTLDELLTLVEQLPALPADTGA